MNFASFAKEQRELWEWVESHYSSSTTEIPTEDGNFTLHTINLRLGYGSPFLVEPKHIGHSGGTLFQVKDDECDVGSQVKGLWCEEHNEYHSLMIEAHSKRLWARAEIEEE